MEPCAPFEEVIENDDLWDARIERVGTSRFPIVPV